MRRGARIRTICPRPPGVLGAPGFPIRSFHAASAWRSAWTARRQLLAALKRARQRGPAPRVA
jgi:hypothetical protein